MRGLFPGQWEAWETGEEWVKQNDIVSWIRSGLSSLDSLVFAAYLGVIGARQSPANAIFLK